MMTLAVLAVLALYALWLLFILAMSFKRAWPQMGGIARAFAAPVIVLGFVWDTAVNVLATAVFLDLPRELTLSHRLKRYHQGRRNWRWRIADWICEHWLDQFDPDGDHC